MIYLEKKSYLLKKELGITNIEELSCSNLFHIFSYIFVINYFSVTLFWAIFTTFVTVHRQYKIELNNVLAYVHI